MSEDQAISASQGAQLSQEAAQKETASQEQQLKSQCEDCLSSSIVKDAKAEEGQKLNKAEAIEKLELIQKTADNQDVKTKIDSLINQLQSAKNSEMNSFNKIQALVEAALKQNVEAKKSELDSVQVQLQNAAADNPFKPKDPFAPTIITPPEKSNRAEDKPRPQKGLAASQKKTESKTKGSIFQKMLNLFK
ncbi:hypothetical protein ACFL2K_05010 [Candidatus Margulisiibacteriota bacterium]